MRLYLQWLNPAITPSCGFKALYRRKGSSVYSIVETSGSTSSGSTAISVPITAPASYEGLIQSDCCDDNLSAGDPWGVNGYYFFSITMAAGGNPLRYRATINSTYATVYDTIITGTFNASVSGSTNIPFEITYPAGSSSAVIIIDSPVPPGLATSVSNIQVTEVSPVFNNGGELQQYDPVNTPPYFMLYTSGTTSPALTWQGSPTALPSFTLDAFNVTETDISDNVLAGDLVVSWAQERLYNNGDTPFDILEIVVTSADSSITYGSLSINAGPRGLRSVTIPLTTTSLNPLTTSVELFMKVNDNNGDSVTGSGKFFYLPDFSF